MHWIFFILLFCLILGFIIQIANTAVQYWPVSLAILAGVVIFYFQRRVTRLPNYLPTDMQRRAIKVNDFAKSMISLVKEHEGKRIAFNMLTSIQQKRAKPLKDLKEVINNKWLGKLLHIEGVVRDVASDWPSLIVKIAPNYEKELFPEVIEVSFGRRWKEALEALEAGSRVQFVGTIEKWYVCQLPFTTDRIVISEGMKMNGKFISQL